MQASSSSKISAPSQPKHPLVIHSQEYSDSAAQSQHISGDSKLANMLQKLSHIEQNLSEMGSQYSKIKKTYEESKREESAPNTIPGTARDHGNETGRSLETIIVMEDGTQQSP